MFLQSNGRNRFFEQLEEAIALSEPGQINIFYVWWSLGEQFLDEDILELWLQRIQPYVESGQVAWKTLPEIYSAYTEWEEQQ